MMEGLTLILERRMQEMEYENYIECIVDFAKEHGLDFEDIIENIDPILKKKIKLEFIKGGWIPGQKAEGCMDDFLKDCE